MPAWALVALVGAAVGYAIFTLTPLVVGALVGLFLVVLGSRIPRYIALFALAFSPLGTMIVANTATVDFRFTLMSWWIPAAGVIVLWLFGRRPFTLTKATTVLAAYGLLQMLSALWSAQPHVAIREGFQFFTFVWIFLVIDNVIQTPRQLETAVLTFLAGASALVGGSAFSQLVTPILPSLRLSGGFVFKFVPEYYHPVTMAAAAGVIVIVSAALLVGARLTPLRKAALSLAALVALGFHSLVLKRLESLALLMSGFLVLSFYGWRRSAIYVTTGALVVILITFAFPDISAHFQKATNVEENPWHYALPMAGFIMFKENPILGKGAGAYAYTVGPILARMRLFGVWSSPDDIHAPHNLVAKISSELGCVGLLTFGLFLGIVLWKVCKGCWLSRNDMPNVQAVCRGMLGASFIQLMVSLGENVNDAAIFWIVLALGQRAARMLLETPTPPVASHPLAVRAGVARPVAVRQTLASAWHSSPAAPTRAVRRHAGS